MSHEDNTDPGGGGGYLEDFYPEVGVEGLEKDPF